MRVIYLLRGAQLLFTLHALWLLYSVSSFCEKTQHSMTACSDMIARIPFATPDQIAEFVRAKNLRSASNRAGAAKNASDASPSHYATTTTARAPASSERSTVIPPSPTDEVKIRKKRDERRELSGNGMTEAQRKAAAVVVDIKKEEKDSVKKVEEKKEVEKTVEVKETTSVPTLNEAKKEEGKEEKNADVKEPTSLPSHNEEKKEVKEEKTEEKEEKPEEKREEKKSIHSSTEKTEEKKIESTTQVVKNEKKEEKGTKVEIPVALETPKEEKHHDEKNSDDKAREKHRTVKKDLKAHVQEPVKVEEKKTSTAVPKLAPAQKKFVVEHSNAFLQEIRCLEVTSDDYFGSQASPFAEHLRGLVFVSPILVVISVYLVCTILRTRLSHETPNEFVDSLGVSFHGGMWLVVTITMYFIYNHWTENWHTVSNNTFAPAFPCAWSSLMLLSSFMFLATSIELWFHKRVYYDIILERSYRCYEVIDNSESVLNHGQFSRTNVY